MSLKNLSIDKTWTLFLDRDGVINKKLPGDYVKKWEEFEFLPGAIEAIKEFTAIFKYLFVVTNQQGIGKGLMNEIDLEIIHNKLQEEIRYEGGRITKIYHSPYRAEEKSVFRKPNPGMARKAKIDFSDIDFEKSIMVGDSLSDIEFGKNSNMYTILITKNPDELKEHAHNIDFIYPDLKSISDELLK